MKDRLAVSIGCHVMEKDCVEIQGPLWILELEKNKKKKKKKKNERTNKRRRK
jgi:hypothetical protein